MDSTERELRIQTICLLMISVFLVAFALYWLRSVMIPFVLALFLAIGLTPLVNAQVNWLRLPRAAAIAITFILGFLLINFVAALISASVGQLAANAGLYQEQIERLVAVAGEWLDLDELRAETGRRIDPFSWISVGTVSSMLMNTTNALVGILSQGLLVLIFLLFLLIGGASTEPQVGVWGEVESRVRRYLIAKAAVSAITGAMVGSVLSLLGIDLALVFGLFAFLLNFIPSVGSVIATLLPLPIVLVNPEVSPVAAALAIAIPALIQFVIGNVVEPNVMGHSLDLHPVVILLALMVWGALWGIMGMLLATPLTAVLKILCERFERTQAIGDVLAGRMSTVLR